MHGRDIQEPRDPLSFPRTAFRAPNDHIAIGVAGQGERVRREEAGVGDVANKADHETNERINQ